MAFTVISLISTIGWSNAGILLNISTIIARFWLSKGWTSTCHMSLECLNWIRWMVHGENVSSRANIFCCSAKFVWAITTTTIHHIDRCVLREMLLLTRWPSSRQLLVLRPETLANKLKIFSFFLVASKFATNVFRAASIVRLILRKSLTTATRALWRKGSFSSKVVILLLLRVFEVGWRSTIRSRNVVVLLVIHLLTCERRTWLRV